MTASVIAVVPIMILFFLMRKQFINGLGQLGTGGRWSSNGDGDTEQAFRASGSSAQRTQAIFRD